MAKIDRAKTKGLTIQAVLMIIKSRPKGVGIEELEAEIGVSNFELRGVLKELQKEGKIVRLESGRYMLEASRIMPPALLLP